MIISTDGPSEAGIFLFFFSYSGIWSHLRLGAEGLPKENQADMLQ